MDASVPQRMRAARLAEAAHQSFVAGFDENERGGMFGAQLAINSRQLFDLLALARVHQQRGAFDFAAAFFVKFAEGGNQRDGKIIHAIEAKVFEGVEDGAFAGAGKAGEDDELACVAFPVRVGRFTAAAARLSPGGGACSGCAGLRGISPRCGASRGCLHR